LGQANAAAERAQAEHQAQQAQQAAQHAAERDKADALHRQTVSVLKVRV